MLAGVQTKRKWWKLYILPQGKPGSLALSGLFIALLMSAISTITAGSFISDITDLLTAYGVLLLIAAFIIWIRNKIQRRRLPKGQNS